MVALGLLGGILGLAYTSLVPPLYIAKASLLVPTIESKANPIGAFSPINMLRGIVSSIELQNRVAKDLGVPRRTVEAMLDSKAELNRNQLEISATDRSSTTALQVVASASKHLRSIASQAGLGTAGRQAAILKRAIDEREQELTIATDRLTEAQRKANIGVDPTNPASALYYRTQLMDTETRLGAVNRELAVRRKQAQEAHQNPELPSSLTGNLPEREALLAAEFSYETARRQLGDSNPELARRKEELESARRAFELEVTQRFRAAAQGLDSEVAGLEARKAMLNTQRDFWKGLTQHAPAKALELMKLNFEVEAIQAVLSGLRQSFDEATLNSGVESVNWTILSEPRAEPEPINKNYGMNTFLGIMVGLFLGGAVSIVKHGA